ncbi:MAG: dihydroorotate dehydrogenase [Treponema sp.]|nr:dihydroorotate dehydrogenase [Treponema sp.]
MITDITDCNGVPYPVYADGKVLGCETVAGARPENSVYKLSVTVPEERLPVPGQFYMIHAKRSNCLLGRPISVYHAEKKNGTYVEFLILKKGKGTEELVSLEKDDDITLLGPLGNIFPVPAKGSKVCIVGGGIGVAPVAGFAESLPAASYDFFASFKSGSYGLDNVKADNLVITTDDGSVGVHGMLPSALTADTLKSGNYSAVYACGPTPMLRYVKQIAEEAGIQAWLSMEARMACGMGVCLGCTIPTTEGYKRCCKDGPVFDGKLLDFDKIKRPVSKFTTHTEVLEGKEKPDMSFTLKGVRFENPVIASSGTFGYGTEYESVFDVNRLGGIASKGLTLEPRQGNDGVRVWETPAGVMNSIGLNNPGIPHFIENELPSMMALKPVTVANLSGSSIETYVEGAKLLEKTDVPVIELNISCPNVAAGGAAFGMRCDLAESVVKAVRAATTKPLIVKLTPQAPNLNEVALTCIKNGADAISLCNSFQGVAIDIETGRPVFDKIKAGFGGPAVRPIAVRLVYEMVQAINTLPENERVPVIAIGGLSTWQDIVEFVMVGASAVEVGTATFANPLAMINMIDGLEAYMKRKGFKSLDDFRGCAL